MTTRDHAHDPVPRRHHETGLGSRARLIAHAWGLIAIATFAILAATRGLPRSIEGGLLENTLETRAQYAFFALTSIGMLLAWVRPIVGGSIAAFAAVGLGVFAGVQYRPYVALLVCLAFFIPASAEVALAVRQRRPRMNVVVVVALVALLALGGFGAIRIHAASFGPTHPQSQLDALEGDHVEWVWSGALSATGATVKAKLESGGSSVRLALSRSDTDGSTTYLEPAPETSPDTDVVTFVAGGLEPGTSYSYAVEVDGRADAAGQGRFTTFLDGPMSFTVAVGACARVGSNGRVFEAIKEANPLFYLMTGDFFYADIDENDPERFRSQFQEALTRPAQAALYRDVPIAYVWDDHDYGPDNSDRTAPSREAARSVYRETVPHYELAAGDGDAAIYQAFTVGRVRFILTDTRSERDPTGPAEGATRSMLGAEQKAWLERELLAANGTFPVVVWVNSVPWIAEPRPDGDDWGGFSEEREELANFIAENGIEGIVMVSGDAHMLAIDDGTNSDYSTSGAGGFTVLQAAALDRRGGLKGGPYSEGAFPGSGQFGLITVEDDGGDSVLVSLRGLDWEGEEIVSQELELPAR